VVPGAESILVSVVFNPDLLPLQGQTIAQIAKLWGKDPLETIFDLLIQDDTRTFVAVFGLSEADVKLALLQPWVSVDCDSQGTSPEGALGKEHPHPRAYGTFPRILRKYVREEKILRLEEAIRKFTALPAQRMNLADRGVLKAGMWADVVVFDPDRVQDLSTFEAPNQLSVGMKHVLVNGESVIEDGQATNALPGKVLRGQGYNGS
jgi:dihydroorotase/N-acyl-D-amino-acid deacylase